MKDNFYPCIIGKKLMLLCVILLFGAQAMAQSNTISGVVKSEGDLELIPGASILIKGTTRGTTTNIDGEFTLQASVGEVLMFSFIGYETQEITVAANTANLEIILSSSTSDLGEVVVVGYGITSREDFTGSVGSLKLENSPVALMPNLNALDALKGSVSGLNIGATNSAGGEPSMQIRGQNSISGSNTPLIVLDGVIFLGSLNDINPNDIASFDVLKDATSAAAYGSRSANGVIAITTKKGRTGKPVITFNTSTGFQTWQNRPVMMKGEEWIKVVNDRNKYTEGSTNWMKPGELANREAGMETNWLDAVTQTGVMQSYQASVSGASESINYYLSSSYDNNKGIVKGDEFNRISILGKINADITDWLEVGLDAGFSRRDYSGIAANVGEAQTMSPYGVMYRDDRGNLEKYPYTQSATNPLWGVQDGTRDNMDIRNNYRLNTYALVNVPWIQGLSYRLNFLTNLDRNESGNFTYENFYVQEGEGLGRYEPSVLQGFLTNANGNMNNNQTQSYVVDNILNYKNFVGDHSYDITLVATRDYMQHESNNSIASNFSSNGNTTLGMWGLHKGTVQRIDLNGYERTNIGYLGRLNYSYSDKYFLTTSYRRDGASVFGANKKWADFAAVGLAWKISNEEFLNGVEKLDNLKLKLSWGQNGNQGIDPYGTLSTVANAASGGVRYEFSNAPGAIYYGLYQNALGNSDLGWETTESLNTGFESSWLNNRLFVDVDLYFSKTTDQIFTRNIPVMTGFKTIKTSMGQVDNTGLEINLKTINIQKSDLLWSSSVTFWRNNNKLVKLYGEDMDGDGIEDDDIANNLFIGYELGAVYGYLQDGIVQETDTEYMELTGAAPGSPKYKDLDGVAGITADDRQILGFTKENFRLNFSNTVTWKNFDLYVMLAGVFGGNDRYLKSNTAAYVTSGTGRFNDNMSSKPYWTPTNSSNVYPSAHFTGDGRFLGLESRGFVRIQDVALSYRLNPEWISAARMNSAKLFVSVKNLATFTNWSGGDPETGTSVRANTFPVPSTFSIGANVSF